jgi:hypothetical protein
MESLHHGKDVLKRPHGGEEFEIIQIGMNLKRDGWEKVNQSVVRPQHS